MKANIRPEQVLGLFAQILSGVEAAHLLKVTHRDLKPENILANSESDLVIGDFGIARFEEEDLYTAVETKEGDRLANFLYAAPEQRKRGAGVDHRADVFALGLILNELFTGEVPQGTEYRTVGSANPGFAWVDEVVALMIRFDAGSRPSGVAAVRELLRLKSDLFEARQKLDALSKTVISVAQVDDPLAIEPPNIVGADFDGSRVVITFDRSISEGWVDALRNMGSYSAAWNAAPERFTFRGAEASVASDGSNAQQIVDHFKVWLPKATSVYHYRLNQSKLREEDQRREMLRRQREEIARLERIRSSLKI